MSALAQYFIARKMPVSGSDLKESEITRLLAEKGAVIRIGPHIARNVGARVGRVILSEVIDADNPEYKIAKKRRLTAHTYAEALGELTKKYFTVAVCGAHGKSTTAALASLTLERAERDPTAMIGTKLREWQGLNFRAGKGDNLVIELDERGKLSHYKPNYIIATNIDREHLDYYKTFENVKLAFRKFFHNVPRDAIFILNRDDEHLAEIGKEFAKQKRKILWYSLASREAKLVRSHLKIPGRHNLANALAVFELAKALKIPESVALNVFGNFKGSWRRAEYKGKMSSGAFVYDDYARHPTEIRATLTAIREINHTARIWCVFQPHKQKRLEFLFDDFVSAFYHADRVVLLDTYHPPGKAHATVNTGKRMILPHEGKTVFDLVSAINHEAKKEVFYMPYSGVLPDFLKENVLYGDIVILMGAGNINEMTPAVLSA